MRIGIDCRTILNPESGERAGVGHYTYNLVKALLRANQDDELVLFFDYRMAEEGTQEFEQPNVTIRFFPFSRYAKYLSFTHSHLLVAAFLLKERLDVFHAPANIFPLTYPKTAVITIHDLAIYEHPEWFPTQMISTRLLVPRSVKGAKHIISVSEATKQDILQFFSVPDEKITVVHEAANTDLLPLKDQNDDIFREYQLPEKYLLFLGTIEPRKNIMVLLHAWQRLVERHPKVVDGVKLVVAGGEGFRGHELLEALQAAENPSMECTGYVPHNHKINLIKNAAAFVFPTLYEGFGLPVLEAMQLGTPVITTDTTAMMEVAEGAALYHRPDDIEGLAQHMYNILTVPKLSSELRQKGLAQARKFSWDKAARETMVVYRKAVGG